MVIGIDTSHNKQYSCVVSGFKNEVDKLYNEIDKILVELNQKGPFHWRRIRDKVRKSAKNKIYATVDNSKVYFTIFEHKSAQSDKVNYFLTYVPNSIANSIENWLKQIWNCSN